MLGLVSDLVNDDSVDSESLDRDRSEIRELVDVASKKRHYFANRKYTAMLRSSSSQARENQQTLIEQQLTRYSKERMRTMNGLLVLCLNLGIDPPDVKKPPDVSKLFTWIDTGNKDVKRAQEAIGNQLSTLYSQMQPRARFRPLVDAHPVSVQTHCQSARKTAGRSERVLFHYNGYGVPLPTANEEIWVFNEKMSKYMPLAIRDLQQWLDNPTVYVFDGNNSGLVLSSFYHQWLKDPTNGLSLPDDLNDPTKLANAQYRKPLSDLVSDCVVLCACGHDEFLPMDPRVPVDLFTCCLVSPIKASLLMFALKTDSNNLLPHDIKLDPIEVMKDDFIPGSPNERRTPFGELQWVLTAITDTIAWESLPRGLFHGLFRHDLVLSALLRHFLVAERLMRNFGCFPRSFPPLPRMYNHPLWEVWDFALESCIQQLPGVKNGKTYKPLTFFLDSLNSFQHWLRCHNGEPAFALHLPILLQVMLVQAHRERALQLLCEFVDLGTWAVCQAITVGLLPYIHRLVTNNEIALADRLVFAWAKIVSIDKSSQNELIKCQTFKYFGSLLNPEVAVNGMPGAPSTRALSAFVLTTVMVRHSKMQAELLARKGHEGEMSHSTHSIHSTKADTKSLLTTTMLQAAEKGFVCFENDSDLRQWLCLCLSALWQSDDEAKEAGRRRGLCESMMLGHQPNQHRPAVRAALVRALAAFLSPCDPNTTISRSFWDSMKQLAISMVKFISDSSPLVRLELVTAMASVAQSFNFFVNTDKSLSSTKSETEPKRTASSANFLSPSPTGQQATSPSQKTTLLSGLLADATSSGSNSPTMSHVTHFDAFGMTMMSYISHLAVDPHPDVHKAANQLLKIVDCKQNDPQTIALARSMRIQHFRRESGGEDDSPPTFSNLMGTTSPQPGSGVTIGQLQQESIQKPLFETCFMDQAFAEIQQPLMSNREDEQLLEAAEMAVRRKRFQQYYGKDGDEVALRSGIAISQQYTYPASRITKEPITSINLHPVLNLMIAATSESVILLDLLNSNIVSTINLTTSSQRSQFRAHGGHSAAPVVHTQFINADMTDDLLMTVSGDGCLRVFEKYRSEDDAHLLTTSNLLADQFIGASTGSKIYGVGPQTKSTSHSMFAGRHILKSATWDQTSGVLYVAGDLQFIRTWSAQVENCIQDIPIGVPFTQMVTTSICHSSASMVNETKQLDMLVAGFSAGQVRVYSSTNSGSSSSSYLLGTHKEAVIGLQWHPKLANVVVSADKSGNVKLWDSRKPNAVISEFNSIPEAGCFAIHPDMNICLVASRSQNSSIFLHPFSFPSQTGQVKLSINVNECPSKQLYGNYMKTVATFHPTKPIFATATADRRLGIFRVEPRVSFVTH